MSVDHDGVTAALLGGAPVDDMESRLAHVEARRFRGTWWLSQREVLEACQFANEQIRSLNAEIHRLRANHRRMAAQVEMYRHGALPSTVPQGPDPMVIELTMRAQDEANETVDEASREGAQIIADARAQAAEIIATAQAAGSRSEGSGAEVEERIQSLRASNDALVEVVRAASHQIRQWQTYLAAQSDRLGKDAAGAAALGDQLDAVLPD
ncbi:hypothetical protein [Plantactinospora sp. GCM10030261]|uniref:hypothetical protein n=1 Tax=Plantactinospora sp. GCM10030261 TaxID=3273420 RepID=UPI00360AA062